MIVFQISAGTGITDNLDIRNNSQFLKDFSFFITSNDTGFFSRFLYLTPTTTNR